MTIANARSGVKGFVSIPLDDRLESRILRIPFSTCWYWIGASNTHGYGQIWADGKKWLVHRLLYERAFGKVPAGKELNHKCETPCCCNPNCLEAVTHSENMRYSLKKGWGPNTKKTHCKRGHPFAGANLVTRKGRRGCLTCERLLTRESRNRALLRELGEL